MTITIIVLIILAMPTSFRLMGILWFLSLGIIGKITEYFKK